MKQYPQKKLFGWGCILSMIFATVFNVLYSGEHRFSFDSLFPKNNFAKATDHCVSVWGTLDQIIKSGIPSVQSIRSIDRSIGQLVLAKHYLKKSVIEKPAVDECHYFARIVGTLSDRYHKLPHIDADRLNCLKKHIDSIKAKAEHFLNRYNT